MVRQACDDVHQERRTLRNAKLLLRKLRGDSTFIPTEQLNAAMDEEIFGTDHVYRQIIAESTACKPQGLARALAMPDRDVIPGNASCLEGERVIDGYPKDKNSNGQTSLADESTRGGTSRISKKQICAETSSQAVSEVVASKERAGENGQAIRMNSPEPQLRIGKNLTNGHADEVNKSHSHVATDTGSHANDGGDTKEGGSMNLDGEVKIPSDVDSTSNNAIDRDGQSETGEGDIDETQIAPRRMRTRAQAQVTSQAEDTNITSPEAPYEPLPIHPIFIAPASAKPHPNYGLPPLEAEETRRLLMVYVQKQEEICRSAEKLYRKLLVADRQRKTVLKWCKAEGHVGEMSDGEDWYDKEEWGLKENLKKGQADDAVEDEAVHGKKTRGRRA